MGNSWLVEGAHLPLFGKVRARGQGPGAQGWPGAGWPAARAAFLAQRCFYRNSRQGLLTRLPGSGASISGLEINVSAFKDGDRETVRGHRHGASAQRLCLVLRAATDCKGRCLLQTTSVTNGSFQEHSAVPAPKAFPPPGRRRQRGRLGGTPRVPSRSAPEARPSRVSKVRSRHLTLSSASTRPTAACRVGFAYGPHGST